MGITIDKIDDGLPISVIVPLDKKRRKFFDNFVLPLLEANNPMEIIVNDNVGSAPKKRNDGFKKATQQYLFFCDDDILLPANYLQTLFKTLTTAQLRSDALFGYTYTGYDGIVLHPKSHPMGGNFTIPSRHFDPNALRQMNYISTMSLIDRYVFPGFDPKLNRFQDWDIYLNMLKNGVYGILTQDIKFFAYYLDEGITSNENSQREAYNIIKNKYML